MNCILEKRINRKFGLRILAAKTFHREDARSKIRMDGSIIGRRVFSVKDNNVVTKKVFRKPKWVVSFRSADFGMRNGRADENRQDTTRDDEIRLDAIRFD